MHMMFTPPLSAADPEGALALCAFVLIASAIAAVVAWRAAERAATTLQSMARPTGRRRDSRGRFTRA